MQIIKIYLNGSTVEICWYRKKREKKIILRNVMHKEIVYINSGR